MELAHLRFELRALDTMLVEAWRAAFADCEAVEAVQGNILGVRRHNAEASEPIAHVLVPGLGTGEGRMPPERCADQMRYAYEVCVRGHLLRRGGLAAARNHMRLLGIDDDD